MVTLLLALGLIGSLAHHAWIPAAVLGFLLYTRL